MSRNRLPVAKALVSGAAAKNPKRYPLNSTAANARPIGEPYASMTDTQKAVWTECRSEMPWLNRAHRTLLRLACILTARMDDGELGIPAASALSSILSKLGATPVDQSRVQGSAPVETDPNDTFFSRTH